VHKRVFQGRGSDLRWPSGFRAEDHLTRIVCGSKVEGVDPWFSERSDIYGRQFLRGDSRVVLSEALAHCYLGQKKLAHAYAEASALKKQNRRLILSEEIFFSRLDAFVALEQQLKSKGRIQQLLPNYRGFWTGMPRPETVYLPRQMLSKLEGLGKYKIVGEAERAPAIVSAKQPSSGGVKLVFKKHNFIHRYRQISCRTTNRVERYEISGSSIRPIYQQDCRHVGPVLKKKLTFQEAPVVLSKAEAAPVKRGMQLIALDNIHAAGDAVSGWTSGGPSRAAITP